MWLLELMGHTGLHILMCITFFTSQEAPYSDSYFIIIYGVILGPGLSRLTLSLFTHTKYSTLIHRGESPESNIHMGVKFNLYRKESLGMTLHFQQSCMTTCWHLYKMYQCLIVYLWCNCKLAITKILILHWVNMHLNDMKWQLLYYKLCSWYIKLNN